MVLSRLYLFLLQVQLLGFPADYVDHVVLCIYFLALKRALCACRLAGIMGP
jgi:hypothetical protein